MKRDVYFVPVIEGAAAGHYTLPEAVMTALAPHPAEPALARVEAAIAELRETRDPRRLRDEAYSSVAAGEPIPADFGSAWAGPERELAHLQDLEARLRSEIGDPGSRSHHVRRIIDENRDLILGQHLHPALLETLERVQQIAPILEGHALTEAAMVDAPPKVRSAYFDLQGLADRHTAIRYAQSRLLVDGSAVWPFDLMRNASEFWDNAVVGWLSRFQFPWRPWPADRLDQLLWFARPEVRCWVPTNAEFRPLATGVIKAQLANNNPSKPLDMRAVQEFIANPELGRRVGAGVD
jgi:hypothetical protein